jgi:hypothetical protein
MKKISFLLALIFIQSCGSDDLNLPKENFSYKIYLNKFVNSNSYKNLILDSIFESTNYIAEDAKISFIKNEMNVDVPIINIYIKNHKNILIGKIEAVSFIDEYGNIDFNILLRNFEKFDFNQNNGSITLIDITENFKFVKANIKNDKVIKRISYNNPKEFLLKTQKHPMDINGDGNVIWSECYKHANDACQTDAGCYAMCYFLSDAVGWVVSGAGSLCQGAIATACVVTSWKY